MTPKNTDELDYQPPLKCGDMSCICHNQQKEWEKEFDEQFRRLYIFDHSSKKIDAYTSCEEEIKSFIRTHFLSRSEVAGIVPEIRGSEEQVKVTNCGLYHWNDCRDEVITRLKKLGIEI